MTKRIILGISGASGVIYGIRTLGLLKQMGCETHLVLSEAGKTNIGLETNYTVASVMALADYNYENTDLAAALASGSFLTDGMIIAPCTVKTLSGIANCFTSTLLIRAADVTLKEKRKLVLMIRETPLHQGHLRLMTMAADMGAHILPPIPSFYHHPKTIEDLIDQTIGKIFDYLGLPHELFNRWDGSKGLRTSKNKKPVRLPPSKSKK
jgi:4-hydroxy-3-polyprenylbenzoate decarboxylase